MSILDVIQRARTLVAAAKVADRCTFVAGSFFESVPAGPDAYLLRHIIHDWDDEKAGTILLHCRQAIAPHGKLLVAEFVLPAGNEPFFGKWFDLAMMVVPGGMERTEAEYRDLFAAAGFELLRVVPTATELSILEAVPV